MRFSMLMTLLALGVGIGCSGVKVSSHQYAPGMAVNTPVGADCYDSAVLLDADMAKTRAAVKWTLTSLDAKTESETETRVEAQRNRHIGVLVGSGGEELVITMQPQGRQTFVTVCTKKTSMGVAGQNPWSCEFVNKLIQSVKS